MGNWLNLVLNEIRRTWPFRWFAYYAAVALAAVSGFLAIVVPDQYVSRAQVYVNTETLLKPLLKGIAVDLDAAQQIEVFQRTLLSDPNVEKVLRDIDMDLDINTPTGRERAIDSLRGSVRVEGVGKELFSIYYTDFDPVRARNVVQSLLTIFIESNLGQSRTDMQTARDFVEKQIGIYATKLREAEHQIAEFRAAHQDQFGRGTYSARLEAARTKLIEGELEQQEAEALRDQLKVQLAKTPRFSVDGAGSAKIIVGDKLVVTTIDRINTLRTELDALRSKYTDNHPDVIAARRELDALVRQFGTDDAGNPPRVPPVQVAEPQEKASSGVQTTGANAAKVPPPEKNELAATSSPAQEEMIPNSAYDELKVRLLETEATIFGATTKVERAKREIEQLEKLAGTSPSAEASLMDLTRDYEVMQKNYQELLARRESARISQAVDTSVDVVEFRIIDPPTLPAQPDGPNRRLILAVGTLGALSGGAFAAYVRANLRGAFVSASDISRAFALPVLGSVSRAGGFIQTVGRSADVFALLTGIGLLIAGVAVAMLVMPIFDPVRTFFYRLLEYVF